MPLAIGEAMQEPSAPSLGTVLGEILAELKAYHSYIRERDAELDAKDEANELDRKKRDDEFKARLDRIEAAAGFQLTVPPPIPKGGAGGSN